MVRNENQIKATFKYGKVWGKKTYIFVSILCYFSAIIFLSLFIWTALTANIPTNGRVFLFIIGPVIAACFALVPFFVGRNRKWTKKCLRDSVERRVVAKLFDEDVSIGRGYKGVKLFIAFRYNGKKIRKHSRWDIYFKRFADREITILYSPKYDEILICE